MRIRTVMLTALPVLILAPLALAADEADGVKGEILPPVKQGLPAMLASFATFLLVLAVLGKLAWPRILSGLNDRSQKIKDEIEAAEYARQQAKEALEEYQKNLQDARSEAQRMLEQARAQQQAIATDLRAKAEAELAQMRERALKDIESAKRAAVNDVYAQATQLATLAAANILKRSLNPDDQRRIMEESMSQLSAMKN